MLFKLTESYLRPIWRKQIPHSHIYPPQICFHTTRFLEKLHSMAVRQWEITRLLGMQSKTIEEI